VTVRTLALIVSLLATAAPAHLAQQRFRTTTDGVRIDVLVTDGRRPIAGLQEKDFILLDQGVRQDIDTIAIEDIPLSMMLALDISESVEGQKLRALVDGVKAAASALGPRDRSALLTFSEEVRLRTPWSPGGSAIVLNPQGGQVVIADDGTISQDGKQVGAIGLFSISATSQLTRFENSGVIPSEPAQPVEDLTASGVRQGYLEGANVNPVMEMSKLVMLSRAFETAASAVDQSESTQTEAIRALGPS